MEVYNWKQVGHLYLWKYKDNPRNYPGWHLTGDKQGLVSLIDLITLMIKENRNSKRSVRLSEPGRTELSIPGCSNKVQAVKKFALYFETEAVEEWQVKPYQESMDIISNSYSAKGLKESLVQLSRGENDFSFGHGIDQIWFW